MRTALALTAGFSLPTAGLVIERHLAREASVGAALDGTLTSIWFAGWFLAGALGVATVARLAAEAPPALPARRALAGPVSIGITAGVAVWVALLVLWTLDPMDPLRGRALAINSAAMAAGGILGALAAVALAAAAGRRAH